MEYLLIWNSVDNRIVFSSAVCPGTFPHIIAPIRAEVFETEAGMIEYIETNNLIAMDTEEEDIDV